MITLEHIATSAHPDMTLICEDGTHKVLFLGVEVASMNTDDIESISVMTTFPSPDMIGFLAAHIIELGVDSTWQVMADTVFLMSSIVVADA